MVLNAYGFLKFLHVVSVIVWVGGVTALSVVAWRMRNERDRQALTALLRQASTYGERVAGPASVRPPSGGARARSCG